MHPISSAELAAPIASLTAFLRCLARSDQAERWEQDGLLRYHTAVPHPWFSGVLISRPPLGDEQATIQEQIASFAAWQVSDFTWWLEPEVPLEAWAGRLARCGFRLNHQPPGMSCQLADLPAAVLTPPGFSIRLVSDLGTLHTWVKTFLEGYGLPPSFEQPFYDLLASLGVHGDLQHYLGWLDGVPVAASSIFYSAGVAGIYNVGVVEPARGQGLGAAITLAPLLEARQRGYPIGALQSSEMGFNVYRRLGFRKVCDVRHFSFSQTPDIHRRVSQVSAGEPPEQSSEIT